MPLRPTSLPDTAPQTDIVAPAGPSFWVGAIKAVVAVIAAQALIAVGLPMDDWARSAFAIAGIDLTSGQAWWVAATVLASALYLVLPRQRRRVKPIAAA